jgi:hypothetical protein
VSVSSYLRELRGREPSAAFAFGDEKSLSTPLLSDLDALLSGGAPDEA